MIKILNSIVCGNNEIELKKIESESVHLILTSPPYDDLRDYKGYNINIDTLISEFFRILCQGGIICWVTADATKDWSESGTSMRTALKFMEKFKLYDTMIYEKKGVQKPTNIRYFQCWEYMFLFSKGKPRVFNPLKDRKNLWAGCETWGKATSRQKDGSLKEGKRKVIPEYSMRRNIWRYAVGRGNTTKDDIAFEHPAMFPERLAQDVIISWSNKGDTILDPFNGSGTTTKMAQYLGRNFIGIDISDEYCNIARKRLMEIVDIVEI